MKKGLQNEAEIDAKIIQSRFWAARGAADVDFDYFLVAFLRSQIFDEFSIGEKSAQNQGNGGPGWERRYPPGFFGRVGGRGGGHGRLLESDKNWQESDTRFKRPCPASGGGGSKGYRLCRRPLQRVKVCVLLAVTLQAAV